MALKVWLPLNGDLRNLGTSNYNISVFRGSEVYDNNGKIGKCFNANGVNTLKISNIISDFYNYTSYSLCAWCYCTAQNTVHSGSAIISGGDWNHQVLNLAMSDWSTDHYTHLRISGTNWSRTYYYNFNLNTWYHIIVSCDGNKTYAYVNGNIIGDTADSFLPTSISGNDICIGGATYYAGMQFFGKINDIRIYDHCLSAAEVKEIAQGLVLHYKLDGFMGGTNSNLTQGSKNLTIASATTNCNISKRGAAVLETRTDGFTQIKGTAAWQGFSLWSNSLNLKVGTTYTYSFYGYTALSTSTNAGISFYPMMYNSAGTRDTSSTLPISVMGGTFTNSNAKQIGKLNTTPQLYWATFTWNQTMADIIANGGKIELSIQIHETFDTGRIDYLWAPKLELGDKPTTWTPSIEEMGIDPTKIEDSSGYNHNGTTLNTVGVSSDSPRYNISTHLVNANSMINCGRGGMVTDSITVNIWIKSSAWGNPVSCTEGGGWNFEASGDYFRFPVYISGVGYKYGQTAHTRAQVCNNQWHMLTGVYDRLNQKVKIYVDGELDNEVSTGSSNNIGYNGSNVIWLGAEATGSATAASNGMAGLFSDFRIYCTPLLDTDIKQLYNVGMKVDNLGGVHSYTFSETNENILFNVEKARTDLTFKDGLNKYTQSNCQVTLTEQGYHIYRPPNLTTTNDGNTMWGGLLINNQTTRTIAAYDASRDNIWNLQKNHTYIFAFHAKGQSSNSPSLIVESNMGWDRIAGVGPNPTYLASKTIPTNFNGEQDCYIIFKIEDDIVKVATENKSSYVQGTSYLSYKELCLNYGYTATGTLGTDLYLTNFRLYDITDQISQIKKIGVVNFSSLVEQADKAQIRKNSELLATEFIEM